MQVFQLSRTLHVCWDIAAHLSITIGTANFLFPTLPNTSDADTLSSDSAADSAWELLHAFERTLPFAAQLWMAPEGLEGFSIMCKITITLAFVSQHVAHILAHAERLHRGPAQNMLQYLGGTSDGAPWKCSGQSCWLSSFEWQAGPAGTKAHQFYVSTFPCGPDLGYNLHAVKVGQQSAMRSHPAFGFYDGGLTCLPMLALHALCHLCLLLQYQLCRQVGVDGS